MPNKSFLGPRLQTLKTGLVGPGPHCCNYFIYIYICILGIQSTLFFYNHPILSKYILIASSHAPAGGPSPGPIDLMSPSPKKTSDGQKLPPTRPSPDEVCVCVCVCIFWCGRDFEKKAHHNHFQQHLVHTRTDLGVGVAPKSLYTGSPLTTSFEFNTVLFFVIGAISNI